MPTAELDFLHSAYWKFRHWENLTQALDDRQTHFIYWPCPWRDRGWPAAHEVNSDVKRVEFVVSGFLGPITHSNDSVVPPDGEQVGWLSRLCFDDSSIREVWPSIMAASSLSQKTDRDERARRRFLFTMVNELAKTENDKDLGLSLLYDFIRSIRAKAAFFSLLNREPRLIADIARLLSFSPYLGALFAARPELIDTFVLNIDEPFSADFEFLLNEIAERKFVAELMASTRFLSDLDTAATMAALTHTADTIAEALIDRMTAENGAQPMDLLCLGKWGGRELGLKSDLDFIFLCAATPSERDQKTAKRFISRMTDPYRGGSLYEIDLRLRPSGKAGPILTTPENLNQYLAEKADIWERQAYLRSRSLKAKTVTPLATIWARPVTTDEMRKLAEIRRQLLKEAGPSKIDLKYAAGGLVDIELAAQTAALMSPLREATANTLELLARLEQGPWAWQLPAIIQKITTDCANSNSFSRWPAISRVRNSESVMKRLHGQRGS